MGGFLFPYNKLLEKFYFLRECYFNSKNFVFFVSLMSITVSFKYAES